MTCILATACSKASCCLAHMLRTNHILRDSAECYMFHTFFGATKAVCSLMHTVLLVMPQQLNFVQITQMYKFCFRYSRQSTKCQS